MTWGRKGLGRSVGAEADSAGAKALSPKGVPVPGAIGRAKVYAFGQGACSVSRTQSAFLGPGRRLLLDCGMLSKPNPIFVTLGPGTGRDVGRGEVGCDRDLQCGGNPFVYFGMTVRK